jgi:hypothetical protein
MGTTYELDVCELDWSIKKIKTTAILSVWDCTHKKWSNSPKVVLRNILLSGLHQDAGRERFCIGEIPENTKNAKLLNPFKANKTDIYFLDLASGSRNHGRFTFNLTPIGKYYYGEKTTEQWKRIIYGSVMHTGCKHLVGASFRYVIVDDTARDEQGNPMDDPTNGKHWETGDCHAKACSDFMNLLGAGTVDDVDDDMDVTIPLQFRFASFKEWVAKGTIAHNPELDGSQFDLVIPISSLKGNKPALGNYEGKLLCGLVFEAEQRRAKAGWMLFQWFTFETLQNDDIIGRMQDKCLRLAEALTSIQDLAALLRIDQSEAEQEIKEGSAGLQSEAEYYNTAMKVIQHDLRGVLLLHPYITEKVRERLAMVWLNLAKAAGVHFWSLMAQPDEYFAKYEQTDENGKTIFSQRIFCARSMALGEYIVFCNPMRHWGDCQLWTNRYAGKFANSKGSMAASTKLMLSLGRDFDGDFVQLIASEEYPHLREAIANFSTPPSVTKLPKMALPGTLQQVAIGSMNDKTGIVASLLGRARAAGAENIPIFIPSGEEPEEPTDPEEEPIIPGEQMAIIEFLSQELQIAVDSIKSAYPNNDAGLKAVGDYLDSLGDASEIPWLKGFKDPQVYLTKPCPVSPTAPDTISQLVRFVNGYWKEANFETNLHLNSFEQSLFSGITVTKEQQDYAFTQRNGYAEDMKVAIEYKKANDGDTTKIRETVLKYQALKESVLENMKKPNGTAYSNISWAAAYWRASHNVKEESLSKGSLVFNLFAEEIMTELKENPDTAAYFEVYGIHKAEPNHWSKAKWVGRTVVIRVVQRMGYTWGGHPSDHPVPKLAIDLMYPGSTTLVGFYPLGLVADKDTHKLAIGETRTMVIWTGAGKTYGDDEFPTKKAWLFDPAQVSAEQIAETVKKGRLLKDRSLYSPEDFGYVP